MAGNADRAASPHLVTHLHGDAVARGDHVGAAHLGDADPGEAPVPFDDHLVAGGEDLGGLEDARRLVADLQIPFVELGFPSVTHHVLRPAPFVGFDGVRVLVERMLEALELAALLGETPA